VLQVISEKSLFQLLKISEQFHLQLKALCVTESRVCLRVTLLDSFVFVEDGTYNLHRQLDVTKLGNDGNIFLSTFQGHAMV